jgi:hypothetical protein
VKIGSWTPRAVRALGALLLCSFNAACYQYVAIDPGSVQPNEEVRVRITEPAATRLVKEFGAYTGLLEGQLALEGADSVSVVVAIGRAYQGMALENARQTLFLGRNEVVEVRRRQLSKGRTALATAGILAGFATLVAAVRQIGDDNVTDEPPPPPPPGSVRALIRIPIR